MPIKKKVFEEYCLAVDADPDHHPIQPAERIPAVRLFANPRALAALGVLLFNNENKALTPLSDVASAEWVLIDHVYCWTSPPHPESRDLNKARKAGFEPHPRMRINADAQKFQDETRRVFDARDNGGRAVSHRRNRATPGASNALRELPESYLAWNEGIAREYFDGRFAGRPVYLDADDSQIRQIADSAGIDCGTKEARDAFQEAVRESLTTGNGCVHLFDLHSDQLARWNQRGRLGTPPFLGLLLFLCTAAEEMQHDASHAAHNFYDRFCDLLLVAEDSARGRVQSRFRADTPAFWHGLNGWLESADGRLGVPTAKAHDRRHYIGLPLSQTLLREHERDRLQAMFDALDLRPHQQMTPADMRRTLQNWVLGPGITAQFHHLWRSGADLQEQLSELACLELEAWSGGDSAAQPAGQASSTAGRLRVAAAVRVHPTPTAVLSMVAVKGPNLALGAYDISTGGQPSAISREVESIELEDADADGWVQVRNAFDLPLGGFIETTLDLTSRLGGRMLRRSPRRVIVMPWEENLARFVENEHAELGASSLILVREALAERVGELLTGCARPGFKVNKPGSPRGVPAGWIVFQDVQIVRIPTVGETEYDLSCLVPVAWKSLSFAEGLKLPGRFNWHVSAPPEIRVSLAEGSLGDCLIRG